jgi:hypothetical protein
MKSTHSKKCRLGLVSGYEGAENSGLSQGCVIEKTNKVRKFYKALKPALNATR